MIQFFKDGVRAGLVAAVMAVVPIITFAQTTAPAIKSAPAVAESTVTNANPTVDENDTDKSTSVQTRKPAKLVLPRTVEIEIQHRFNESFSMIRQTR